MRNKGSELADALGAASACGLRHILGEDRIQPEMKRSGGKSFARHKRKGILTDP
jgi:hypothetical protein